MEPYNTWSFVSGFFQIAQCLRGSSSMYQCLVLFDGWIIFSCVHTPWFISPFIRPCTLGVVNSVPIHRSSHVLFEHLQNGELSLTRCLFLFLILPCLFPVTQACCWSTAQRESLQRSEEEGQDPGKPGNTPTLIIVYFICHTHCVGLFSSFGKID